jgi:hypothetical protein
MMANVLRNQSALPLGETTRTPLLITRKDRKRVRLCWNGVRFVAYNINPKRENFTVASEAVLEQKVPHPNSRLHAVMRVSRAVLSVAQADFVTFGPEGNGLESHGINR